MSILAILEAGLFVSSAPLALEQLKKICEASDKEILAALQELQGNLQAADRGLILLEKPEGFQLGTKPGLAPHLERLYEENDSTLPLSQAALETLVIVALKEPVTRLEIENIRGVKVEGVLENLIKRGFVQVSGRRESLGRPFLYRTTESFLHYFGLQDLAELQAFFQEEEGQQLE